MLFNGLGRYDDALCSARRAVDRPPERGFSNWAFPDLVEAAARCGRPEAASAARRRMAEMAAACRTDWILGLQARSDASLAMVGPAEDLYVEAIDRLGRTPMRADLARARLLYGEWLRRQGRRVDAREQLRSAAQMSTEMGAEAFACRAARELRATGECVRKRRFATRDELTAEESQIALLARDGLRTPRSARGCLSARARSSATSTRPLPSCKSAHAPSSIGRCPANRGRRS